MKEKQHQPPKPLRNRNPIHQRSEEKHCDSTLPRQEQVPVNQRRTRANSRQKVSTQSYLPFGFPRSLRTRANSSFRCSGVSLFHRIFASPAANEFLGVASFLGPQRASAAAFIRELRSSGDTSAHRFFAPFRPPALCRLLIGLSFANQESNGDAHNSPYARARTKGTIPGTKRLLVAKQSPSNSRSRTVMKGSKSLKFAKFSGDRSVKNSCKMPATKLEGISNARVGVIASSKTHGYFHEPKRPQA